MTKTLLSSGQPIAQAKRQARRIGLGTPPPTGDATTASSTAWATTAVASATPHTKGTWVEVVSATTMDIYGLLVAVSFSTANSGANTSALLDIGVGAAASEAVVIPDIGAGYRILAANVVSSLGQFPVFIPSGSRIAIRCQGAVVSQSVATLIEPITRLFSPRRPSNTVVTIGADAATSKGVNLAVPGGANTKGAWTQITAATAEPFTNVVLSVQGGADTSQAATSCLVDLAVGASGAEVTVLPNVHVFTGAAETVAPLDAGAFSVDIPAGSRIAARYQTTVVTTSLDVHIHGIR